MRLFGGRTEELAISSRNEIHMELFEKAGSISQNLHTFSGHHLTVASRDHSMDHKEISDVL